MIRQAASLIGLTGKWAGPVLKYITGFAHKRMDELIDRAYYLFVLEFDQVGEVPRRIS